ncbi:MAG TPA: hypothetical protein VED41_12130 [Solirubrobacteraceae bacterium]|nr:hypothetical protein [Solirubrobacteraceae bacterium]
MRWIGLIALVSLAAAMPASAQVLWVGVADGTSWDWQPATAPGQNFLHNDQQAPSIFVAFPISGDTLFRLRAANVPHDVEINGASWPGKLRAYTAGIDYLFPGTFGEGMLSGGFGSYRQSLQASSPPTGYADTKVGWYLGVGEWFMLTRRTRVTGEVTMNYTPFQGGTTVFVASVGLAAFF